MRSPALVASPQKFVSAEDCRDLVVLLGVRQQGRLAAGADGGVLQEERALEHGRGEAQRVEVGAKSGKDRLLLFGFADLPRIERLQDACKYMRHGVAEARNAAGRAVLQRPEHEVVWAGIDLKTVAPLGNLQIGLQPLLCTAGIPDAGNVAVAGERAPSSCDMVPVAGLLHPTMSNGQQGTEKTERIGRRLIFVDDCDPLARRFQIG
ncbi:hypothetical protein D9M69_01580 [compost metagenome]